MDESQTELIEGSSRNQVVVMVSEGSGKWVSCIKKPMDGKNKEGGLSGFFPFKKDEISLSEAF